MYELIAWWLVGCAGFAFMGHAAGYAKGKAAARAQVKNHDAQIRP